jgi:hypothetical protein
MRKLRMSRSTWFGISGLAALALGSVIAVVVLTGNASSSVALGTIDPRTLKEIGLTISATSSRSAISKATAETRAETALNARGVRESVLAQCHFGDALPTPDPQAVSPAGGRVSDAVTYDGPCWVVSLSTAGVYSNGPPGSAPIAATYVLALIDPQSGQLIRGFEGSGP